MLSIQRSDLFVWDLRCLLQRVACRVREFTSRQRAHLSLAENAHSAVLERIARSRLTPTARSTAMAIAIAIMPWPNASFIAARSNEREPKAGALLGPARLLAPFISHL